MQFAGKRHRMIVGNIANISTPNFRPVDVSVDAFRADLADAIDTSRKKHGNAGGPLVLKGNGEVEMTEDGRMVLHPSPSGDNILFHDENDRDVERLMQDLVENFGAFRAATQLMRSRMTHLNMAISQRV